jgi:hypothetical protein
MKRTTAAILIIIFGLVPATLAKDASFSALRDAVNSMSSWFDSLIRSTNAIVASEDRRRLIDRLSTLSKAVYDLENNQQFLVDQLKRTRPGGQSAAQRAVTDTRNALADVIRQLHDCGLLLRQQYRTGGDQVEQSLSTITSARGIWLGDIEASIGGSATGAELSVQLQEGTRLREALRVADQQLIKLITELQTQH